MGTAVSQLSCITADFLAITRLSSGLWRSWDWFAASGSRNIVLTRVKWEKSLQICWTGTSMLKSQTRNGSPMWRSSISSARNCTFSDSGFTQWLSGQLFAFSTSHSKHGDHHVGKGFWNHTGRDGSDPPLRPGVAIPAQTVPENAQKEEAPTKHEPKRELSG